MVSHASEPDLPAHLKALYAAYRHTSDIDAKGLFFSTTCHQICRPRPSYAAQNRDTIVRYLREAAGEGKNLATSSQEEPSDKPKKKGYYTIRPLKESEFEFGSDEQVTPAGFRSASELKKKAVAEGWVGMRVDLWDEEGLDEEGKARGMLVKVQYWWRKEDEAWIQILHDIMFIGTRDGTEGSEGDILE